jgi:DHA1 family bicyclomycin/chloramphenicol resistance-like MFS transporter
MQSKSSFVLTLVLASLAALAPFAIDTYLPAFHTLQSELGTSDIAIQQSLTFYLVPYTLMTLWHGAISDSIGRLAAIRWGLTVFVLASIGCAMAQTVETLWFFRALQGLSGGAGNVVARAMVRDLFEGPQAQRVMAMVQMLFGIAPAIAPIIGGWLLGIHWQAIFIFLALYAGLSLTAAMILLPETMPANKRVPLSAKQVLSDYRVLLQDSEFKKLIFAVGANFAGFFLYVLSAPVFLMQHLHLSEQQFAYMFIPTVACMMLGSYFAKRAAGVYSRQQVIRAAYRWMAIIAVFNLMLSLAISSWQDSIPLLALIAPVALFNIGMALAMPVLSLAALDRHARIRGTAASAQTFVQMLISSISAGLVVPLLWFSPAGLALGMCVHCLLSLLVIRRSHLWMGQ